MSSRTRAILMLLAVSAIWGVASPVIKVALPHLPPVVFLTYRFAISTVIMVPILLTLEPKTLHILGRLSLADWLWFMVAGVLGSSGQLTLLFLGLDLTTTLDGSIINSVSPVFVAIAGYFFLKEKFSRREIWGHVIAFLGTVLVTVQPILSGQSFFSGSLWGNFLVLLGTLAWVIYVILTKKQLNHKLSPLLLTTNMFVTGFIFESILLFVTTSPTTIQSQIIAAPLSAHLSVLYMALFSGTLAYYLYQKAQKLIEVSEANLILYASPLFTLPLSYFWLKEQLTLPVITGCLVIAAGIVISEFRPTGRQHIA